MRLRIALAAVAGAVALATAGPVTTASAAAGYVPHRCYVSDPPPGGHRHFVLRIPYGAALVYRGRLDVTALARHTPYFP